MFVGHYAAALALKRVEKRASLGVLFLAVQFVDILFFPFVLAGIERINLTPNFTQSTHFELEYMPYTHSLLASFVWAGVAYAVFRWIIVKQHSVALVIGLAALSHWFLDLIVHVPDLPLWSDASTKLGFGLWQNSMATYTIEAVILVIALWYYLGSTISCSKVGRFGMGIFVVTLLLINIGNVFAPPVEINKTELALSALASYFLFAAVAFWLDRKRN